MKSDGTHGETSLSGSLRKAEGEYLSPVHAFPKKKPQTKTKGLIALSLFSAKSVLVEWPGSEFHIDGNVELTVLLEYNWNDLTAGRFK